MSNMIILGVLMSCLVASSWAASNDVQLPTYMKACKKSTFDECVMKQGNAVISSLWKGDPKYKIPVIDPYKVVKIEITESSSKNIALNLTLFDLFVHGLKNAKMIGSKTDFKKKQVKWTFSIPKVIFKGTQKTSGKFLVLPITGKGPLLVELKNVTATFEMDWTLENRKGKQWMKTMNGDFKYKLSGLAVNFEGLFNGDKALEKNMNRFLNENWEELTKAVGPSLAKALASSVLSVLAGITKLVPYENLVL